MLTFDGVWNFWEVFSSRMNHGCHCTVQMVDSVYGIVWVSGLLMSTFWIEWPKVAVGLCYGQAYVMDNEHRCILLMTFWMHRDTVTRSWGPLLCHSSTTITSCCSMIMHGPMLQGSVHNSWKEFKRNGPTFHRPQSTIWSTLCEGDVLHCMRQIYHNINTYDYHTVYICLSTVFGGNKRCSISPAPRQQLST